MQFIYIYKYILYIYTHILFGAVLILESIDKGNCVSFPNWK